jgi:hypothetical protein
VGEEILLLLFVPDKRAGKHEMLKMKLNEQFGKRCHLSNAH